MLMRSEGQLFSCSGIYSGPRRTRDTDRHQSAGRCWRGSWRHWPEWCGQDELVRGFVRPPSCRREDGSLFKGKNVTALALSARARLGIGRTYQTPVVPDELTVGETFKAARQAYRPYLTKFDAEYGAELVGLNVADDEPAVRLDALNRRKLLLACLLMRRPSLLLMDEPASGLINSEVDEIDYLLRVLSKEMNIAIAIVEHRIELLGTIADRVMVMDAGEVISEGVMKDILVDPKVHAAYFENFTSAVDESKADRVTN